MIPIYEEILSKSKSFNMVNMSSPLIDEDLKPLFITVKPRFITLTNEIYYQTTSHYQTDLKKDISFLLSLMNEKVSIMSLDIEKNFQKEFITEIYNKNKDKFKPYKDSSLLTGRDIRDWLNYNANIFSLGENAFLTGIYNSETMELINSIKRAKQQVYDSIYQLSINSSNTNESLKQLLIHLKKYRKPSTSEFGSSSLENFNNMRNFYSDMYYAAAPDLLVQYIGFDKIESTWPRTITTSKQNIYEAYYNYIIFDYNIVQIPKLYFDKDNQKFRWIYPNEQVNLGLNRELEKEAQLVKKHVPYEQRYKYTLD